MADITLTYKGNTIAEISDSGSKTLQTEGKYCEGNIGLTYVKPSGGNSFPVKKIKGLTNLFRGTTWDSTTVEIDFDGADINTSISTTISANACFATANIEHLIIKNLTINNATATSFCEQTNNASIIKTITFTDCTIKPSNINSFVRYGSTLQSVTGEIDMTNVTNMNACFQNCTSLTSIRFKANSLKISTNAMNQCPFDDATLVNLGNSLDGTVTGKTITLASTQKTRCGTLMGTNNSGTFVADAQGSMSLETFITTVKGWTLA